MKKKHISKTIESILSQKVKKFIVIINDNSLDSTEKKCKKTFIDMANLINIKLSTEKNYLKVGVVKFGP